MFELISSTGYMEAKPFWSGISKLIQEKPQFRANVSYVVSNFGGKHFVYFVVATNCT